MIGQFIDLLLHLEQFCTRNDISHRFVGSASYGGLLNNQTSYTIDVVKKRIYLKNYNQVGFIRKDNSIRDIDIILFTNNDRKIQLLKKYIRELQKQLRLSVQISLENAIYPMHGKRSQLLQLVTSFEVDEQDSLYLTFDSIQQQISWKSVEPWQVILGKNLSYTTRNPIADFYAYQFRSPGGIKPKDQEKVALLNALVDVIIKSGRQHAINYNSKLYYAPWKTFIHSLTHSKNLQITLKKYFITSYWHTIGTYVAHGKGLSTILLPFSNQFTGIKQ